MKNRYRLLASILMFATLPLFAENSTANSEEVALEMQETASFGNRGNTLPVAKTGESNCRKKKEVLIVPEEQVIEMQRGTITPSVYPYISQGTNSFGTLAFIWWKSVVNGTAYAYNGTADGIHGAPVGFPFVDQKSGTLKRPDFGFQPGCKVGLGTHFDHDGWEIYAEYTYLAGPREWNDISPSPLRGAKSLLVITTADGHGIPLSINYGKSKWDQDFNVVDFELGRNFFISKYLTLKPNVGLKTAWVHHTAQYKFEPVPGTDDTFFGNQILKAYARRQQHMWGLGIRAGLDTMWHFDKNWAIYGDIAFTTLWADFHVRASERLKEAAGGVFHPLHVHFSVQTLIPVIETGLGLTYIDWFCDNKYRLQVQAGWEEQIWTDVNYFQVLSRLGSGSMTLQGLTMKAGLTF